MVRKYSFPGRSLDKNDHTSRVVRVSTGVGGRPWEVVRVLSAFARPLLVHFHWGRLPCTFCLGACLSESANHGLLLLLENTEAGPVCGFSDDARLQPPNCLGRLPDFHGTLAFSPQKRLGRFVDFHVTLAFSFQIARAGCLIFMGPWHSAPEVPGVVCGFSCDTCLQPPKCLGRLLDFHGTLAFSPQKRLGRLVDFHVTLAFSLQSVRAGFLSFMGPWPSASEPKCLDRLQSLW